MNIRWSRTALLLRLLRKCRHQAGQALIETAVSLPLLLVVLLGGAELARVAYAAIEVSNAASAAALYAASSHAAATNAANISTMAVNDAANLGSGTGGAVTVTGVSTSCACANPAYTPTSCTDNTTCRNNQTVMVATVTVTTQATFRPLLGYLGGPTSFTLKGRAVQTVGNE
jgi:Flp pilus assembly protein TadG